MNVVLDTCAVLWLTLEPDSLSPKAHKIIANAERLVINAVSVWEIGLKATRKKLDLGTDFLDYVERLGSASEFDIVAVDHRMWARSVIMNWDHKDPADRLIVALAQDLNATIISEDDEIKGYYKRVVV